MARILVVDDDEGVRSFIAESLETQNHHVTEAASGEEALKCLQTQSFHLLITDLRMPGQGGLQLLQKARSGWPDMEAIVLTAFGTVQSAVEAMKLGAFDFLQKPLPSPEALRLLVGRALERSSLRALRERVQRTDPPPPMLSYGAPAMQPVVHALQKVAPTDATVLLLGESGTGKEVAARLVHTLSPRSQGPFVAVNCAALSDTLLESELFGHEKGAFTGAQARRRGRIELADGGTFFLDEVGELKPEQQAKLLRVLQERRIERLGGAGSVPVDVRWVAATNRDLQAQVAAGLFRSDLFHRLAVFPIQLPPLRERRSDIPPIAEALLLRIGGELGKPGLRLTPDAAEWITAQQWPGNVRELANALERAAILAENGLIDASLFPSVGVRPAATSAPAATTLDQLERQAIQEALRRSNGHRKQAAEQLGIGLRTLYDKLKQYGIS
ncbi:MAG: sigma-54 dependent transcriptional regulator [Polyangia bacterium]